MLERSRTFYLETLGCRANQYDSEVLRRHLLGSGYREVDRPEEAEVLIVNSCVVTHKAERDVRKLLSRARRRGRPGAEVILTGCMVPLHRQVEADFQGNLQEVLRHLNAHRPLPVFPQRRARAILKVQDGCSFQCNYCIVPRVRGPARSRPLTEVLKEARDLVAAGFQEIVITGIQVGGWGRGLGYSLVDLFRAILQLSPTLRIRLSSLLPHYLTPELLDFWASEPRMARHFHLPLQSGSSRILRLMLRPYTLERYEHLVHEIHRRMPEAAIGTDLIAGFPGETDQDFEETYRFVEALPFAYFHVFEFSPREGTEAARMPGAVPAAVRKERVHRLIQLGEVKRRDFMLRQLGREEEVLVEQQRPDGSVRGTTGNYLRVVIPERLPTGRLVRVRLLRLQGREILAELLSST